MSCRSLPPQSDPEVSTQSFASSSSLSSRHSLGKNHSGRRPQPEPVCDLRFRPPILRRAWVPRTTAHGPDRRAGYLLPPASGRGGRRMARGGPYTTPGTATGGAGLGAIPRGGRCRQPRRLSAIRAVANERRHWRSPSHMSRFNPPFGSSPSPVSYSSRRPAGICPDAPAPWLPGRESRMG